MSIRYPVAEFQVSGHGHVLVDGQVQQQVIALRDVRRHLAEASSVPRPTVDFHRSVRPDSPDQRKMNEIVDGLTNRADYLLPAKMFISDVLPAPEGPRMAVRWPDRK